VVFLSEFSSLGWIRAEIMVEGKEVHVEFTAAMAESTNRLREQLPILIENLKGQGFHVGQTRVTTLDPELLKHSMAQELRGAGAHSISTFV
jgi:flagellar hook-length control protein FliK